MSSKKVALVTGATSGIGVTVAKELAEAGFTVAISGRSKERGAEVESQLGAGAKFFPADVSVPEAPKVLVSDVVNSLGRIDVLVNNAAIDHTNDLLEVQPEEIQKTFETNTFGAMNLLIAVANQMKKQGHGGSIINVTSRLASIGVPTMGVYSASKGSMLAFTKAAAIDLAKYNIRVNAVAPGMTRTPLYQEWLEGLENPAAEEKNVAEAIPLGRIAEPEDVAAVVTFLASDKTSYLTGISIPVDGGYLAK